MKEIDPRELLWQRVKDAGSQKTVADELGISQPYLHDILHGNRGISDRILEQLRLRRTVVKATV